MKRRSFIALLLVFAMALVGCGNSAPKDGNDKKANGNKQGAEATKSLITLTSIFRNSRRLFRTTTRE